MRKQMKNSAITPYVDAQTSLAHLSDYRNPRDCIARMVKNGELWRLKNGFYLIAARFVRGKTDYPYEQVANLLYGPSYVSLEWALSYYHFIPERVSVVTNITLGSNKEFSTPIGTFTYRRLNASRYSVGIDHKQLGRANRGFLIATPEKALVRLGLLQLRQLNEKELLIDLTESKRIEIDSLKSLNKELMKKISLDYKSNITSILYKIIDKL